MNNNRTTLLNNTLFGVYTQHGGVALRILIALITLIIIAGVIVITLSRDQEKQQVNHRKVVAICEYGLQNALQKLHDEPSWRGGIEKTSYDGGWYKVNIKRNVNADTLYLLITAESHLKDASDSKKCILSLSVVNGDSLWLRRSMQ